MLTVARGEAAAVDQDRADMRCHGCRHASVSCSLEVLVSGQHQLTRGTRMVDAATEGYSCDHLKEHETLQFL